MDVFVVSVDYFLFFFFKFLIFLSRCLTPDIFRWSKEPKLNNYRPIPNEHIWYICYKISRPIFCIRHVFSRTFDVDANVDIHLVNYHVQWHPEICVHFIKVNQMLVFMYLLGVHETSFNQKLTLVFLIHRGIVCRMCYI